jgi:hypothetical protein
MITQWLDFVATTAGGAVAFICLFEGTRRMRAYGIHRTAVLLAAFGTLFCLAHVSFSYWRHVALKDMAQGLPMKMFTDELPPNWGKQLASKERETSSLAMARIGFVESGKFRSYFDQAGERRKFSPSEDDIKSRDAAVVTKARLEDAVGRNFGDALVWLIWAIVAGAFGFGVAGDKRSLPANPTVETDARKSGARGSP